MCRELGWGDVDDGLPGVLMGGVEHEAEVGPAVPARG